MRCVCCMSPETTAAVDPTTGLCLYCQPCPKCGRLGTGCDDALSTCAPDAGPPS